MLTKSEVQLILAAAIKLVRSSPASHRMTLGKAVWNTGKLDISPELRLKLDHTLNFLIEYDFYAKADGDVIRTLETKFTQKEKSK